MKKSITISLAQTPVVKADIPKNVAQHITFIQESATLGADVVVFPELSLTGYELELAQQLMLSPHSECFQQLSRAAVEHNIIVIAGCPLENANSTKPTIAAVICFPDGDVDFYSKQYLHDGEGEYCVAGDKNYLFNFNGHEIALAICADFANPAHSDKAATLDADIYLVSALISEKGYPVDAEILAGIANKHQIPVLLANHISQTGGWQTCGNNTVWNAQGRVAASSQHNQPGLVLCTITGREVTEARLVTFEHSSC